MFQVEADTKIELRMQDTGFFVIVIVYLFLGSTCMKEMRGALLSKRPKNPVCLVMTSGVNIAYQNCPESG